MPPFKVRWNLIANGRRGLEITSLTYQASTYSDLCKLIWICASLMLVPWWMYREVVCFVVDPQLPRISFCSVRVAFSCLLGHSLISCPLYLPSLLLACPPIHFGCPEATIEEFLQKLPRIFFFKRTLGYFRCLKLLQVSTCYCHICFARSVSYRVNII